MTFTERVESLCKDNGITVGKMLSDIELAKGVFTNWKTRGTIPGGEILIKISSYFDVTVDFLLGIEKDCPKEQPLSEDELFFLQLIRIMSPEQRKEFISRAVSISQEQSQ